MSDQTLQTAYTEYTTPDFVLQLTGETVVQAHCLAAGAIIKNYSGIQWDKTYTLSNKVYSGNGSNWLDLGYYPVIAVTSVLIDDSAVTDYKSPAQHGQADGYLYRQAGWNEDVANVKVSFTYGYAEVPEFVKVVASRIAALLKNESYTNISTEKLGEYSIGYVNSKNTKTEIDLLLSDLPKNSNITAVGGDSIPNVLDYNERIITSGN